MSISYDKLWKLLIDKKISASKMRKALTFIEEKIKPMD